MYWFKRKYRQIKRTIEFLPLIWKGADWDYRYAVELFQHQLNRTADYIEDKNRYVNAKADSKRIRTAVNLLEKVYEEEYSTEYQSKIEKKYGKSKLDFIEYKDVDAKGNPYYRMIERFEHDYTDAELLLIEEEKEALMHESMYKQKRAHSLVWKYIEHNIQAWWD
jgi:hypothetical protein|tara:strand:+ start:849 stop:1343 length:495 start_codon:yes stop_codon:yes gene_type:complete